MAISLDKMHEFEETLKNTSYDKSRNEYLSDSDIKVISFDEVKTCYCIDFFKSDTALNSVDAILTKNNQVIFIEFKNGEVKTHNVKSKLKDSILICCDKFDLKVEYFRENAVAILVYNVENNPVDHQMKKQGLELIRGKIFNKSNIKEFIRFGLEMYKGMLFKEVHTYTQKEFDEYVKANLM